MVGTRNHVLVAGATGYLGSYVVREFANRGYRVRALARDRSKAAPLREVVQDVHIGNVTSPSSLTGSCEGIDIVFSSIGITRQRDGMTFWDVDYQGNKNLLNEAVRSGVSKFIYVSVFDGPNLRHLDIVKAHEDFVAELKGSGLDYAILRPTGYFSDLEEIYKMARRGRVYLIGQGERRVNPIHGADLAGCCVDSVNQTKQEIDVGGPDTMTWREIAELAFIAQGKPVATTCIPLWMMSFAILFMRLFSRHQAELLSFFTAMAARDVVAPNRGTHRLGAHYQKLAGE